MFGSMAASGLQGVFETMIDDIHLDEVVQQALEETVLETWDKTRNAVTSTLEASKKMMGSAPWMTELTGFFSCDLFQGKLLYSQPPLTLLLSEMNFTHKRTRIPISEAKGVMQVMARSADAASTAVAAATAARNAFSLFPRPSTSPLIGGLQRNRGSAP